ncbi:MAG TPA: TetR/AcrR family transcriptional regulator [Kofleriaceae bacterium]
MKAAPTARRVAAAARRLLDREGADAVTMRRVGDAVGITAMAIYRHYPDRAALLNALADQGFAELAAALGNRRLPRDVEARLLRMVDIGVDYALAHPRLFELMFLAPRQGARRYPRDFKAGRSPTGNVLIASIEEGMASGVLRDDDPWEVMFEIGALIDGLVMLYLGGRMEGSPARFRALCKRALRRHLDGIKQ